MSLPDFSKAPYTAIVSDLHLCEEEPLHPKYPLWKKYKTRQFFFDQAFNEFLDLLEKKSGAQPIELILNGDIFDFDSVCTLPIAPPFRISWLERRRGLHPQEHKSAFKIKHILDAHEEWVQGIRRFLLKGHRVIFVIGNHDTELHFPQVQQEVLRALNVPEVLQAQVRFNEWFYISNGDTLIEHGHQYDPFCVFQDPINPFVQRFNKIEVRLPFGNLATRYMINGMGFFNPHVDTNFIMSAKEYLVFFFKYMMKAQPLLMFTWLWGASIVLWQSFIDRLRPALRNPLTIEDRVEFIASKANATPRMVRELSELFEAPASSYPLLLARELWLDRAVMVVVALALMAEAFLLLTRWFQISFLWLLIPLTLFVPFFIFYSRSISSTVIESKEPKEKTLSVISMIAKVNRVIYGHTHLARHEIIGPVEHLNSGTWSPAFKDVECERPIDVKTYVWIEPDGPGLRRAQLYQFKDGREITVTPSKSKGAGPSAA